MPAIQYAFDPKDPSDTDLFPVDWTAFLAGDPIVGNPVVTVSSSDLTVESVDAPLNQVVSAWISGGVAGKMYLVSYQIHTQAGRTVKRSISLPVQSL